MAGRTSAIRGSGIGSNLAAARAPTRQWCRHGAADAGARDEARGDRSVFRCGGTGSGIPVNGRVADIADNFDGRSLGSGHVAGNVTGNNAVVDIDVTGVGDRGGCSVADISGRCSGCDGLLAAVSGYDECCHQTEWPGIGY